MRHARILLSLVVGAFLPLVGCQRDTSSTAAHDSSAGTVSFTLPAALRSQVQSTADSLRIELRQGDKFRFAAGSLDSTVRVSELETGSWAIQVGLYSSDGILRYFGESSVQVRSGELARAEVTLRPAKGSVDIEIHLEGYDTDTLHPKRFQGTWYLSNWTAPGTVPYHFTLVLDSTGKLTGWNGRNVFTSLWNTSSGNTLSFPNDPFGIEMASPWGIGQVIQNNSPYTRIATTSDSVLSMRSIAGTFAFKLVRAPHRVANQPSMLLGKWNLLYVDTTNAPSVNQTLEFSTLGAATSHDGCNSTRWTWTVDSTKIELSMGLMTMKYCSDLPESRVPQLSRAQFWAVDGDRLSLRTADGILIADYDRARQ